MYFSKTEIISNLIEEINWKFPTELNLQKDVIDQIEILLLSSHTRTDTQIESIFVPETNQYLGLVFMRTFMVFHTQLSLKNRVWDSEHQKTIKSN